MRFQFFGSVFALCVVYNVCTLLSAFQFTVLSPFCFFFEMTYFRFRAELVQLIVSRSDSELRRAEIRHEEKYFDC